MTIKESNPVTASKREQPALDKLETLLQNQSKGVAKLVGPEGEEIELPESVTQILRQSVDYLVNGQAVSVVAVNKEITTQEAADHLNVSRPYMVKLLESGELPFRKVGKHRRIRFDDLMTYKMQRDTERRQLLAELTEFSQELGLYNE